MMIRNSFINNDRVVFDEQNTIDRKRQNFIKNLKIYEDLLSFLKQNQFIPFQKECQSLF